jgi:hypothetical protein
MFTLLFASSRARDCSDVTGYHINRELIPVGFSCLNVTNAVFDDIWFSGFGGAIYIKGDQPAAIDSTTFVSTVCVTLGVEGEKGGAIYCCGRSLTISRCCAYECVAEDQRQFVYMSGSGSGPWSICATAMLSCGANRHGHGEEGGIEALDSTTPVIQDVNATDCYVGSGQFRDGRGALLYTGA